MKITVLQRPSKTKYENLINRAIETLDDAIEQAKKDKNMFSYGLACGHWETLDSLKNVLLIDGVETDKDMDKFVDSYIPILDKIRDQVKETI